MTKYLDVCGLRVDGAKLGAESAFDEAVCAIVESLAAWILARQDKFMLDDVLVVAARAPVPAKILADGNLLRVAALCAVRSFVDMRSKLVRLRTGGCREVFRLGDPRPPRKTRTSRRGSRVLPSRAVLQIQDTLRPHLTSPSGEPYRELSTALLARQLGMAESVLEASRTVQRALSGLGYTRRLRTMHEPPWTSRKIWVLASTIEHRAPGHGFQATAELDAWRAARGNEQAKIRVAFRELREGPLSQWCDCGARPGFWCREDGDRVVGLVHPQRPPAPQVQP